MDTLRIICWLMLNIQFAYVFILYCYYNSMCWWRFVFLFNHAHEQRPSPRDMRRSYDRTKYTLQCRTVSYSVVQCRTVSYSVVQCRTVSYSVVQCRTVSYSVVQCRAVSYSVVQCRTVSYSVVQCRTVSYSVVQCRTVSYSVVQCRTVSYSVVQCRTVSYSVVQCRTHPNHPCRMRQTSPRPYRHYRRITYKNISGGITDAVELHKNSVAFSVGYRMPGSYANSGKQHYAVLFDLNVETLFI